MRDSETSHIGDDPTTEVELSADDLLKLSSPAIEQSTRASETQASALPADVVAPIQSAGTANAPLPSVKHRASNQRTFVTFGGLAAAAIAAIGVHHGYSTPAGLTRSSLTSEPRAATAAVADESTATEPPPVQFTNPFDPSEVFEFPAGTSHAEARDAVAELLLKRAMERQELHARN